MPRSETDARAIAARAAADPVREELTRRRAALRADEAPDDPTFAADLAAWEAAALAAKAERAAATAEQAEQETS